jgi:type III secretory pathway component EscT
MITLVLALRGAVAVAVLLTLVGGIPPIVRAGIAVTTGLWATAVAGPQLAAASGTPGGAVSTSVVGPGMTDAALWLIAGREIVVGATLGLIAAVPLLAVATTGRLVDRASRWSGSAASNAGPYQAMFSILAAAVFVGVDGHVTLAKAIATSFHDAPALAAIQPTVLATLASLVPAAAQLAIPWLITAAVLEIATGVAMRLADRAASHGPITAATPAALAMMTASLISTGAVAVAAILR